MTTREYTKILKSNPNISTFEVNQTFVKGTVTITRFRPKTEEKTFISYNNAYMMTEKGNEVDIEFKGMIRSKYDRWHDSKTYTKSTLTRWMRGHKQFMTELHNRTSLIGGDRQTIIKKITLL